MTEEELKNRKRWAEGDIIGTVRELVKRINERNGRNGVFTQDNEANIYFVLGLLTEKIRKLEDLECQLVDICLNEEK